MEAEEVLLLIMKKLKEYKAKPLRSSLHEKARQKSLMKMFCIYTSLKKKERAKQRQIEQIKCDKELILNESNNCNEIDIIENNFLNNTDSNEVCVEQPENVEIVNDLSSQSRIDDATVEFEYISETDNSKAEVVIEAVNETTLEEEYNEESYNSQKQIQTDENNVNSKDCTVENGIEEEEYIEEDDDEQTASVDGFLMQLGEGLKRLPYRERAKLEIEFLERLYEMEECVGALDD